MTGAANRGNAVYINKDGAISGNEDIIRLTRVVSKVRFNIGIAKGETGKTFRAEKYSIVNVACTGSLFSSDDAGAEKTYSVEPVQTNFNDISGIIFDESMTFYPHPECIVCREILVCRLLDHQ